jgi:hypothetical protein
MLGFLIQPQGLDAGSSAVGVMSEADGVVAATACWALTIGALQTINKKARVNRRRATVMSLSSLNDYYRAIGRFLVSPRAAECFKLPKPRPGRLN